MSDLGSPSLTPRPVTNPDPSARVVGRVSSATDNRTPQQHHAGAQSQDGEEEAARAGHHDPAVTLATTLAQVQAGEILHAIVTERDADQRPMIMAHGAVYLLDAAPRVLSQLQQHHAISVKIVAVERLIAAEIIALDDIPSEIPIPVVLSLLKVDPTGQPQPLAENETSPATPVIATYRPATSYVPRDFYDNDDINRIAVAAPLVTETAPKPMAVAVAATAAAAAEPFGRSFITILQPHDNHAASSPETVSISILRLLPAPGETAHISPDYAPAAPPPSSLIVKGIITAAPTTMPPAAGERAPLMITTAIGNLPLPRDVTLPKGEEIEIAISRPTPPSPAPSTAAPLLPETDISVASRPLLPEVTAAITAASSLPMMDALPEPMQPWPLMQAVITGLQNNPPLASAMSDKLPSARQFLTPTTLLFLNLIGIRSPARLLLGGDGVEELIKNGGREILEKLEISLERLKSIAAERAAGEWRPYVLPFHGERGLASIIMLVRQSGEQEMQDGAEERQRNDSENDQPQRVTRFVLELSVGKFGATQIDGIIKGRSFNLALRLEHALGAREIEEMRALFHTALDHSGFSGDISFRSGLPFPVSSAAEWHRAVGPANALSA
ncbi:MAG: hypothetical protein DCC73_10685 [Proteobacteria bacterium]|nr:MAG: hypothetical protein DCC73_10685 [Pseudomonadota bacterium]